MAFSQGPGLLDTIPGARAGVSFLLGKVSEFQRLPLRINEVEKNAVLAKRAAESRQDWGRAARMAVTIQAIAQLRERQQQVGGHLADVLDQLRQSGFGQTMTLALGLSVAKVASEVQDVLSDVSDVERDVGGGPSALPHMAKSLWTYALLGTVAYAGIAVLRRKRG